MHWNTLISPASIAVAFAFSAGVGLFFGIWPARKAASASTRSRPCATSSAAGE